MDIEFIRTTVTELLNAIHSDTIPNIDNPLPMNLNEMSKLYLDMRLDQILDELDH